MPPEVPGENSEPYHGDVAIVEEFECGLAHLEHHPAIVVIHSYLGRFESKSSAVKLYEAGIVAGYECDPELHHGSGVLNRHHEKPPFIFRVIFGNLAR
jgi:hypothetical protein